MGEHLTSILNLGMVSGLLSKVYVYAVVWRLTEVVDWHTIYKTHEPDTKTLNAPVQRIKMKS
jgi:hypothetical protein